MIWHAAVDSDAAAYCLPSRRGGMHAPLSGMLSSDVVQLSEHQLVAMSVLPARGSGTRWEAGCSVEAAIPLQPGLR